MRGLCRIGCGCILEYESHKFSDDFEYLLPKDLDNKPHHCVLFTIVNKVAREGLEMQDMNVIYQAAKKKLDIRYEKFEQLIDSSIADSGYEILGPSEIWHMMGMLRYGRLYELIQGHQLEITNRTLPFLKYRQYLPSQDESIQLREKKDEFSLTKKNIKLKDDKSLLPNEMCNAIPVILPTDNGYQLEYLGFYYELMTKFEDAKKCYDLQYQFTEEPELLEKSDELEKKIKKRNKFQKSMDDLKLEDAQKEVKHEEVNLKKYVTELFSNDFREI